MGIPAGKPKTIVVDLTGKFLSASREVRIVTNLCVYWDEIFLAEDGRRAAGGAHRGSRRRTADLRFRGFSPPVIHPRAQAARALRLRPPARRSRCGTRRPGYYTRYGDVRELLAEVDDRWW